MPGSNLFELMNLGGGSDARSLSQLAVAAVRSVPGCLAANVALWTRGEPVLIASTHPDLPALIEVQVSAGRGPALDALSRIPEPVSCPDTLADERWPEFSSTALLAGVRCSLSSAHRARDGAAVTLTLAGARSRCIDPRQSQTAELLGALGSAVIGAVSQYDDARRTASQLLDAAEGRAVVDQAKGILMHALGCTAEEALERLRQASQRRNIRAVDLAREVVESGGRLAEGSATGGRAKAG
ncbi:MAG TPA: ANTAR domain-containing protein [Streptosporangiaceae bacterium]|nr:ANTAR domain-containing protein [Streptosporangiaceae bacterium]